MDAARACDRGTLAVIADRANGCSGYLVNYHLRVDAEQLTEVRRPWLNADGLIATPVDDRGRHACHTEQRLELCTDVLIVNRAVGHRIPASVHRLTRGDRTHVPHRHPATLAIGGAH